MLISTLEITSKLACTALFPPTGGISTSSAKLTCVDNHANSFEGGNHVKGFQHSNKGPGMRREDFKHLSTVRRPLLSGLVELLDDSMMKALYSSSVAIVPCRLRG